MKEEKSVKESKQVNFRIDPDSAEAFRLFCTTHGMNQAQGFDHLMQVLELNNAKVATPGRAVEIENFERLTKELLSSYINSIELSNNAEARVLERFQSDLKRKDHTIDELREKIAALDAEKKEQATALSASKDEQNRLKEQAQYAVSQMEAAKKASADQEEINRILQAQNQELQSKTAQYESLKESEAAAQKENAALCLQIKELEQNLAHESKLRNNLELDSSRAAEQLRTLEQQLIEYKIEVADLKRQLDEKDTDTENLMKQAKMQADLEQERAVIAKERELQEELRKADRETVKLQTELEQLKASILANNKEKE